MASGDDTNDPADNSAPTTLAEKIDRCFITMHPPGRGPYTNPEVSTAMAELGVTASSSYLWHLRVGKRTNPTLEQIQALAKVFHVPAAYFVGNDEEVEHIDAQMAVVRAMRDPGVRDVALRAGALSPAGLRAVVGVLREFESTPGLAQGRSRKTPPMTNPSEQPHGRRRGDDSTPRPPGRRSSDQHKRTDKDSD